MKRCVVSFADTPDYRTKMERLRKSMTTPGVDFLGFTDVNQIGSKPHSEIPYAFKPYAIKKAIELGYESILWCDSPIVQVKDLRPLFEYIEGHGYVFFDNVGHTLGMWTNDKALNHFGISREEAMGIKMIMACCMGFSLSDLYRHPAKWDADGKIELLPATRVHKYLEDYIDFADELYPGSWSDHRHDQSVMSLLIHHYGLDIINGQQTFFMYENHRHAVPINEETICLISK